MIIENPTIETVPLAALRPYPGVRQAYPADQSAAAVRVILDLGVAHPVTIDEDNVVLAGYGQVALAQLQGLEHVACVRLIHLSAGQKRYCVNANGALDLNTPWSETAGALGLPSPGEIKLEVAEGQTAPAQKP